MTTSESNASLPQTEQRIASYLSLALRPMPLLAALTAAGLTLTFLMGLVRIIEPLGWQLLAVAFLLAGVAAAHGGILGVAEQGSGMRAFALHTAATILTGLILSLLWEGTAPLAILIAWIAPAICIPAQIPRRAYITAAAFSLAASIAILILSARPLIPRLPTDTTGSFAAVLLVTSMVILFVMLVLATQAIRYRTLQTRLTGTLVPIIAVPILFTTAIAAYNALTTSQQQFRSSLEAVSALKRGQLGAILEAVFADLSSIQHGSQEAPSIMHVLERPGATDEDYRLNASVAATQLRNVIVTHPASDYDEVMVIDAAGDVLLSTYVLNQGVNFGDQEFFRQGLIEPTARFIRYPGLQNAAGEYRLVGAAPFYGETPDEVLGVVVGVARPDAVQGILQPTAGLGEVQTYLVDTDLNAVSAATTEPSPVGAPEIREVVANRGGAGSGTYLNPQGVGVLGYYEWDPGLQSAMVSEVSQLTVYSRSLAAVVASGLVGLLTIIIAGIAVLSASRAISEPVTNLASAAEELATGRLSARAGAAGEDEIGRLGAAFNSMAAQLEGIIGNLEQRVAERTRALEQQSLRLRTAAEVARDAALAPTLDDLLARASRLVLERFGVDHVGLYLLDDKRQYAVLQAAPTDIGRQMLAAKFRVAVGDRNAIGQAAASGEPQLVLGASGSDLEIGDGYHSSTQSQLALPLRTNEGTIGLLDLQTDTPDAFAPADTAIVQILADQLAASIERGRLLLQVQERLDQLEESYRRFTQESWAAYTRTGEHALGYRYDNVKLEAVTSVPQEAAEALAAGRTHTIDSGDGGDDGAGTTYLPIQLRGQTLGVVSVKFREGRPSPRTLVMVQQAAERLGTALENVRLLDDSLRRASRERLVSEITSRIGSSVSVRNVLQTAVEELGRAMPGSDVSISLRPQNAPPRKGKAS